ncbi:MAG: TRAP-type transport system small permease protein [Halanaerobiales bacterium]|nr:TRAP-type transport system small permease protein [Halanaerobiales bacterium]
MVKKIYRLLIYIIEELIPIITLALTVVALIIQVFFRYVLNISLEWPFELSIYAFVWTLYLGAAYARREGKHVKLDIIYNRLSPRVQAFFNLIFNIITTWIFLIILYPVWNYLLFTYRIKTVALKLPWTYVFMVFPIFLVLTIIHNIKFVYDDILFLIGKKKKEGGI